MRRLLLSLVLTGFTIMALLGPVATTTMQIACDRSAPAAMAGMDHASGPTMSAATAGADKAQAGHLAPCCDPSAKHKSGKGCAQACGLGAPMAVAQQTEALTISLGAMPVTFVNPDPTGFARALPGLRRPPKSVA